jgi:hypothetical protein
METIHKTYDSLSEYLTEVGTGDFARYQSTEVSKHRTEFTGSRDFAEALNIAKEGIDLGAMALSLAKIETDVEQYQMETTYDVSGMYVDIGRYLTGEPECMIDQPVMEVKAAKTLVVDIGNSAKVKADVFKNKAIAIAHMIDKMEASGTRVELYVLNCFMDCVGYNLIAKVRVKAAEERLTISQIVGVLHPSFFRRIGFAFAEKMVNTDPGGYGMPLTTDKQWKDVLKTAEVKPDVIVMPNEWVSRAYGFNQTVSNLKTAEEYVNYFVNRKLNEQ